MNKAMLMFYMFVVLLGATRNVVGQSRSEQHEKLGFLVGEWQTTHTAPSREGEPTIINGEATITWVVGDAWLRHEFEAEFPGRGKVYTTFMMNYSPPKKKYNFYMFDHFGGEAGIFYGDWVSEKDLVVTASFKEDDGSLGYQKFTLTRVSENKIWINRAFSDDGVSYHFEVKGAYTRKEN